jgi:hypothetical protein
MESASLIIESEYSGRARSFKTQISSQSAVIEFACHQFFFLAPKNLYEVARRARALECEFPRSQYFFAVNAMMIARRHTLGRDLRASWPRGLHAELAQGSRVATLAIRVTAVTQPRADVLNQCARDQPVRRAHARRSPGATT